MGETHVVNFETTKDKSLNQPQKRLMFQPQPNMLYQQQTTNNNPGRSGVPALNILVMSDNIWGNYMRLTANYLLRIKQRPETTKQRFKPQTKYLWTSNT